MSDDQNNQRPRHNRGRNRPNRNQQRNRGPRGPGKRPLLSSATTAAGLSFVGLLLVDRQAIDLTQTLSMAVLSFILAAIVSYISQRLKPKIIEKLSDAFFLFGLILIAYVSLRYAGLV